MTRYFSMMVLVLLSCCGCAMAQLDGNSKADDVLEALKSSGQQVKSFSASVKLNSLDNGTGAEVDRFGKVYFQIKPDGEPVMHIVLDKKQVEKKKIVNDKVEYLLDDGWLTDRKEPTESRIQLVPKGQKMNLFQLGKSPFPMPIGQDPAEIHKQFDVTKVEPAKEDPQGTIHLLLKPKPDSAMARRFDAVDIWTDMKTKMPVRIKTVDAKGVAEKTADLTEMKVNTPLAPEQITLPPLPKDWRTSDTPLAG